MSLEEARAQIDDLRRDVPPVDGAVRLDLSGTVAHLVIDNPSARNAISLDMMAQLLDAVVALREWRGAALVVSAADSAGVFCSGGHLGQVVTAVHDSHRAAAMSRAMSTVLDGLLGLPVVSVTALDGAAIGGGAELCTATDFRVGSPRSRIHFLHAAMGIAPGWGGAGRLVRLLGRRSALRLLGQGASLTADEALDLGLLDVVADDPLQEAQRLLAPILAHPAPGIRAIKEQVHGAGDAELEGRAFGRVWGGPDHRAALDRVLGEGKP